MNTQHSIMTVHGAKTIFDRTDVEVFLYDTVMPEIYKACKKKNSYVCIRIPEAITPEEMQHALSDILLFKTKFYRNDKLGDVVCYVYGWSTDVDAVECAPMCIQGRYEEFEPNCNDSEVE